MSKEAYNSILAGLEDASAYAKGDKSRGKVTRIRVVDTDVERVLTPDDFRKLVAYYKRADDIAKARRGFATARRRSLDARAKSFASALNNWLHRIAVREASLARRPPR